MRGLRCVGTRAVLERKSPQRFPAIEKVAIRKLQQVYAAADLSFLRVPPGNRLEKLHTDRMGQWSIRINDQYRICFLWEGIDAYNVEIVDYH